jgi:aldehyde dehydrogenase (NAD+)
MNTWRNRISALKPALLLLNASGHPVDILKCFDDRRKKGRNWKEVSGEGSCAECTWSRVRFRGLRAFPVGDPADPKTAIGPMVSQKQYDRIQSYIRKGIEEGAEVLVGGEGRPQGFEAGYFVKPTVFVNVKNEMTIAQEEIFGPVLSVIVYDSEDEAIRIANDSKYGLHAAVLGTDIQRARRVASQIRAGRVVINNMTDDPQAPWGGFKYSGVGREYGRYGIEAFLETRAILES